MGILHDNLFLCLLCGHLLGDFYFQTDKMAGRKDESARVLRTHALVYAGALLLGALPFLRRDAFLWVLLPMAAHFVIDAAKAAACGRFGNRAAFCAVTRRGRLFLFDQALHLATLGAAAWLAGAPALNAVGRGLVSVWHAAAGAAAPAHTALALAALVLLLGKPANVLLKQCNTRLAAAVDGAAGEAAQPPAACGCPLAGSAPAAPRTPEYPGAGAIIGTLERLLVAVLCMMGQYAAVGLVFTAKTLTRYDRISKDPPFAEYYLIGTLGSLLFVLCATRLLLPGAP